jgi:hypothetical protein
VGAELCDLLADIQGVGLRDALLIVAVQGANYLGDGGEAEDVVYPDEIGLIRVGFRVDIGDEGWAATS